MKAPIKLGGMRGADKNQKESGKVVSLEELSAITKHKRLTWGFVWGILCALLWGLGYVPVSALWCVEPIASFDYGIDPGIAYLVISIVITAIQALIFAACLFLLWTVVSGKAKDYVRTWSKPRISKWLILAGLFGGPLGTFGCNLSIGYIGADFTAAMGLMTAVTGAIIGRIFNKEKLSKRAIIGLCIILGGGLIVLNPFNMIDDILNPASPDGIVLGYIGAIMVTVGMGIEGFVVSRVMDVTDSDVSAAIRYAGEAAIWFLILLPVTGCFIGFGTLGQIIADCFTSPGFLFFVILSGCTLGLCYAGLYKSYPLLGVGRTLSITTLYVPISMVALFIFMGQEIMWWVIVGAIIAIVGTFVMYWESGNLTDSLRDVGGDE